MIQTEEVCPRNIGASDLEAVAQFYWPAINMVSNHYCVFDPLKIHSENDALVAIFTNFKKKK